MAEGDFPPDIISSRFHNIHAFAFGVLALVGWRRKAENGKKRRSFYELWLFRLFCLNRPGTRTNLLGERFGDQIFVIVVTLVVHFVYARARHLRVHAIKGAGAACARLIS